jgi:hypothetical protein
MRMDDASHQQTRLGMTKYAHTSVNDLVLDHLGSCSRRLILIDPIRLVPMIMGNQTKLNRSICQDLDSSIRYGRI